MTLIADTPRKTVKDMSRLIMVSAKTPMMRSAATTLLDTDTSLSEAAIAFSRLPAHDEFGQRVAQQIAREMSGRHDFLVVRDDGTLTRVEDPERTTLGSVAVAREFVTDTGVEKRPAVSFEVQAYAPVGAVT
jgi:hypothetical protein